MSKDFIFTSRSVTGGHPDKLCDQISDALIGQFLRQDPMAMINAQCAVATGVLFIAVRFDSAAVVDSQNMARAPSLKELREDLMRHVIGAAFSNEEIRPDSATRIDINAEGVFLKGGPAVHSGLTGRKSGDDTYGDYARHTGMALSGKDPTRIGRTGTYAARYAAKNVVAAGLADECEVQLSYTSGLAGPISLQVETFGTGRVSDQEIVKRISDNFDFRLGAIIREFDLRILPQRGLFPERAESPAGVQGGGRS